MSDTHIAYLVTLDKTVHGLDARNTLTALRHVRGVCSVEPVGDELDLQIAQSSLRQKMYRALTAAVNEVFG